MLIEPLASGTLVLVKQEIALHPKAEYYRYNEESVAKHGYIYKIVHLDPYNEIDDDQKDDPWAYVYEAKSISTGHQIRWAHAEIEEMTSE